MGKLRKDEELDWNATRGSKHVRYACVFCLVGGDLNPWLWLGEEYCAWVPITFLFKYALHNILTWTKEKRNLQLELLYYALQYAWTLDCNLFVHRYSMLCFKEIFQICMHYFRLKLWLKKMSEIFKCRGSKRRDMWVHVLDIYCFCFYSSFRPRHFSFAWCAGTRILWF